MLSHFLITTILGEISNLSALRLFVLNVLIEIEYLGTQVCTLYTLYIRLSKLIRLSNIILEIHLSIMFSICLYLYSNKTSTQIKFNFYIHPGGRSFITLFFFF